MNYNQSFFIPQKELPHILQILPFSSQNAKSLPDFVQDPTFFVQNTKSDLNFVQNPTLSSPKCKIHPRLCVGSSLLPQSWYQKRPTSSVSLPFISLIFSNNLGVLEAHNVDRDGEMSEAISSVIQSALALSLSVEKIAQICGCGVDYVRQIQESMENVTAEQ